MSAKAGDGVRLVATRGVAAPSMRAQVGKLGVVVAARRDGAGLLIHARFPTPDGPDLFWLKPGEYELVPPPPASPPPAPTTALKETPVDFAASVQERIDALDARDRAIVAQLTDLARARGDLTRERKALEAARTAYRRVQEGIGGAPARDTPAVVFVRRWAASHGGLVVLGEAIPTAQREGVASSLEQARDRVTWAARRYGERVAKGVYRLRGEEVA